MRTPDHHSRRFAASLTAAAFLSTTSAVFAQSAPWQLIWSDEFDGQFLNLNIWEPQIGTGTLYGLPSGWGNNERQYYTDRSQNLSVGGGWLTITARREDFNGSEYTSARIRTRGRFEFLYGRVEARITIPSGQGIWPAFWMLPTNSPYGGWAASGEIDIMESTNNADQIYGTIHHGGPYPGNRSNGGTYAPGIDFGAAPHLYAVEWDPDQIRWYVDGVQYYSVNSSTWSSTNAPDNERAPFDVPFHFLLNVAVGGNFPGPPNGSVGFPMQMQVDYVRVFRRQQLPYEPSPALIPGQIEAERFDLGSEVAAQFRAQEIDARIAGDVDRRAAVARVAGEEGRVVLAPGEELGDDAESVFRVAPGVVLRRLVAHQAFLVPGDDVVAEPANDVEHQARQRAHALGQEQPARQARHGEVHVGTRAEHDRHAALRRHAGEQQLGIQLADLVLDRNDERRRAGRHGHDALL